MGNFRHTAVFAAGFAAVLAAASPVLGDERADPRALSLQSFGASRAISAYELSAPGLSGGGVQPTIAASLSGSSLSIALPGAPSLASSTMLAPNLALDTGRGLDVASRFTDYGGVASPLLSAVTAPYLALANGGRYAGVTFAPADHLRVRLGASVASDRLDRFHFDMGAPSGPLALTYDAAQSNSLLGGLSFDLSDALGVDVTGIATQRSGLPLGFGNDAGIARKSSTAALGVAAHMNIGQGWVINSSFSEGMTQLDPRANALGSGTTLHEQSYALAIAKHGLFGDDALGLAFSRPAPSMAGSFAGLSASGDLPPLVIAQGAPLHRAQETDFQLGYVTNFLDGAVALQTNAAYQTNAQGQPGATSVSLLSRAKIKF